MDVKISEHHAFKVSPGEAMRIQQHLRNKVITGGKVKSLRYAAGVDVSFRQGVATAAVAVISLPGLQLCDAAVARREIEFPYIPGLLSFREIPVILDVLKKIHIIPDIILCDGQGIAHPRRLGIASHLGVLTGLCTIGVAKSRLTGNHDEIPVRKGEWVPLYEQNETIGAVLCTRDHVKPLYISIGHRIDLIAAIAVVMRCVSRYRLPETTRLAHCLAGQTETGKRPD